MIKKLFYATLACGLIASASSCENQKFNDDFVDIDGVHVDTLSLELQKVRDYVPQYAVVAHRGSTFWTPEETEAAYRWAREMGADYLEADLQVSKDGVILALHDSDLKRTTNIEDVFGENLPREIRLQYYKDLGYSDAEAREKLADDIKAFVPNYPCSYTYQELMMLDAGKWFNETSIEQARTGFVKQHQYISTLEDLIMYSKGYKLKRTDDPDKNYPREYKSGVKKFQKTGNTITNPLAYTEEDVVKYNFEYEIDTKAAGHIPGIYIEFKETWLNPAGFEKMVYDELAAIQDMNIIEKPATETAFYKNGKVNVGNTNGKVILQTFSLQSLKEVCKQFDGKIPMCFLLWKGTGATDLTYDDPAGYASFINLGVQFKAHFMGPCIAGAPNNYPELNQPWQHYLIHRAKMKNHPYSFDTYDQMAKYCGQYYYDVYTGKKLEGPYLDALFTNHTDMTLQYMLDNGLRLEGAATTVPDPREVLDNLGYKK